jgi:hypothetical protein
MARNDIYGEMYGVFFFHSFFPFYYLHARFKLQIHHHNHPNKMTSQMEKRLQRSRCLAFILLGIFEQWLEICFIWT